MLTDNGRQYTSWRGTSRFEAELKKEGVAHFKSRPQHPMTLGKIERFWSTIWQEFLTRAQFESFDSARERIRCWIKYYNHKRPHQGIEGLCPADRFFEVQSQLRKTIQAGIADNVLEMALRGQPRAPFYMVGRITPQQDKARQRAMLIMQVRSGQLTATQAARTLGVSRKTYYQWEQRGLEGMIAQLQDLPPGRPPTQSDPQIQSLQNQLSQAQEQLEEARQIKELRMSLESLRSTQAKKNSA